MSEIIKRHIFPGETNHINLNDFLSGEIIMDSSTLIPIIPTLNPDKSIKPNDGVDYVNNPPHYKKGDIECIDAIKSSMTDEQFIGYLKGNVFKYLWRMDYKDDRLTNAKKGEFYFKKLLESLSKDKEQKT